MQQTDGKHQQERRKNFLKYVAPSVLGFVSIFLFTVIDGIFVGQGVGQDAVGAVNIAFPFIMIYQALTVLVSVGGLTISAIRKGRGDGEGMNQAFMHSVAAVIVVSALFMVLGMVFTGPVSRLMGANDNFLSMTEEYIFWYSVFFIPCGLLTVSSGAVRNDESPILVSASMVISTVCNIFGDWLLIFPLRMGLTGAAVATGLSQTAGLLVVLSHFARKKGTLRITKFSFDPDLLKLIFLRGMPECISQINPPVVTMLYNRFIIANLGNVAENAYAVIGYVASFAVAAFAGVGEGVQPLFGQSYGSRMEEDLLWYRKTAVFTAFFGALIISILIVVFGEPICSLYGIDAETLSYTMENMPKYSLGFAAQAVTVIISSYLYSTTRTKQALMISVLRSFIVDTAVIFVLPVLFGPEAIWYAFFIYELIITMIAVIIMRKEDAKGILTETLE